MRQGRKKLFFMYHNFWFFCPLNEHNFFSMQHCSQFRDWDVLPRRGHPVLHGGHVVVVLVITGVLGLQIVLLVPQVRVVQGRLSPRPGHPTGRVPPATLLMPSERLDPILDPVSVADDHHDEHGQDHDDDDDDAHKDDHSGHGAEEALVGRSACAADQPAVLQLLAVDAAVPVSVDEDLVVETLDIAGRVG